MGTFTIGCLIKNLVDREKTIRITRIMVDTGSEATWIPRKKLEEAGIKSEKRQTFPMVNGQWIYRDVGYALVRIGDRDGGRCGRRDGRLGAPAGARGLDKFQRCIGPWRAGRHRAVGAGKSACARDIGDVRGGDLEAAGRRVHAGQCDG